MPQKFIDRLDRNSYHTEVIIGKKPEIFGLTLTRNNMQNIVIQYEQKKGILKDQGWNRKQKKKKVKIKQHKS